MRPSDFGLRTVKLEDLIESDIDGCVSTTYRVISGDRLEQRAKQDLALANAAAAIVLGGIAADLKEGVGIARHSVESGAAYRKLVDLIRGTGGSVEKLNGLETQYG